MTTASISLSFYEKVSDIESKETIPFDIFLDNIRNGAWQDHAHAVRTAKDKEKREKLKKRAPSVTISGTFTKRYDNNIIQHSGYLGIDIDRVDDPEELKSLICHDRYIVAAFVSIGGKGLCLIIKVNPAKHKEAFQGFCEYLHGTYGVIADPTSINPSRARFVSYDPYLYEADSSDRFAIYPKDKTPKKIERVIYSEDDFSQILHQIVDRQVNIAEHYHEWLRVGFALVHKFGEQGREYFHIISSQSAKYDSAVCDKQYDACMKHQGTKETTISTVYYYAKQNGIVLYSPRTLSIMTSASQARANGLSVEEVEKKLKQFEQIEGQDVKDIIKQVIDSNIEVPEESTISQLRLFLRQNYRLERNAVIRQLEVDGQPVTDQRKKGIFIKAKEAIPKLERYIFMDLFESDEMPEYDPFRKYLSERSIDIAEIKTDPFYSPVFAPDFWPSIIPMERLTALNDFFPLLSQLFSCIDTPQPDYALYFGSKWLTGVVATMFGDINPLFLILSGRKQNTGKTQFFVRLLPADLKKYFTMQAVEKGKDSDTMMTNKLIILEDEMEQIKSRDVKKLKQLTSMEVFTIRTPYEQYPVDLRRLCNFAGTSNEDDLIADQTGNRRLVPIHVEGIDNRKYNGIDKNSLWREIYILYSSGFNHHLNAEEIAWLGTATESFEAVSSEADLIIKHFEPGNELWSPTDIKVVIELASNQRLSPERIGKELKALGFEQEIVKRMGKTQRLYRAKQITGTEGRTVTEKKNLPF